MTKRILLMSCAFGAIALSGGNAFAAAAAANGTTAATEGGTTIQELVVTAQRREENLQDAPLAVSAFSQESLKSKKIDGGDSLLLQVPNVNYTRTNFGGFDLKIRGVGTDVVGASGTSGVSINENELPLASNHFADTDFYDVQRVEVVRGPQGTLYGRNATGGAVNVITNLPTDQFGGYGTIQYGNYNTIKMSGAINLPLGDMFALRVAGIRVFSDGFGENTYLNQRVDGRDLGSVRATLSFKPNDKFDAYLMFEHYSEDDTRNRVGKQLCIKDPGPASVGGVAIAAAGGPVASNYAAFLNQGCLPGSLTSPQAYGTLNSNGTLAGVLANLVGLSNGTDLFGNNPLQDHNLHNIQSVVQPSYKAQQDIVILHMNYHITDSLTLTSITGFNRSTDALAEDYNRIVPVNAFSPVNTSLIGPYASLIFPGGYVQDPQTGTSNKLTNFDLEADNTKEYTQELRLNSSFKGKLNFSAGLFYSEETAPFGEGSNYYVTSNALTGYAVANNALGGALSNGLINIDPNQIPNGSGHNYYDSRTGGGYLKSYAAFGEVYYEFTPQLKLTLGGRYTTDQLYNLQYPVSLESAVANGNTAYAPYVGGFPTTICSTSAAACLVPQRVTYREFTGRANLDWTPTLSFTDKTLFYATYSRGYKGGGFNTPCAASLGSGGGGTSACGFSPTYNPEFIDAFEVGTKNTLLGGSLTLNADAFYYIYKGYQIATIVAESAVNQNINAKIYGAEFESIWQPIHNLALNANIGYLHTSIDTGQTSIDQLNLTQGDTSYTLVKNTAGANCLAPTAAVAGYIAAGFPAYGLSTQCAASGANEFGVAEQLGGHQLPNSPDVTVSVGAQYTLDLTNDWKATVRGDYYWQDNSFARIYNAVNDYLPAYHVVNATLTVANPGQGLEVQAFVKNAFNTQPITGTYLTDATSGLFQNVFTLDPRTFGVAVTKKF
jgi:outer membrane receptor protein involved in Fe transport